jgi:hypothetical protein
MANQEELLESVFRRELTKEEQRQCAEFQRQRQNITVWRNGIERGGIVDFPMQKLLNFLQCAKESKLVAQGWLDTEEMKLEHLKLKLEVGEPSKKDAEDLRKEIEEKEKSVKSLQIVLGETCADESVFEEALEQMRKAAAATEQDDFDWDKWKDDSQQIDDETSNRWSTESPKSGGKAIDCLCVALVVGCNSLSGSLNLKLGDGTTATFQSDHEAPHVGLGEKMVVFRGTNDDLNLLCGPDNHTPLIINQSVLSATFFLYGITPTSNATPTTPRDLFLETVRSPVQIRTNDLHCERLATFEVSCAPFGRLFLDKACTVPLKVQLPLPKSDGQAWSPPVDKVWTCKTTSNQNDANTDTFLDFLELFQPLNGKEAKDFPICFVLARVCDILEGKVRLLASMLNVMGETASKSSLCEVPSPPKSTLYVGQLVLLWQTDKDAALVLDSETGLVVDLSKSPANPYPNFNRGHLVFPSSSLPILTQKNNVTRTQFEKVRVITDFANSSQGTVFVRVADQPVVRWEPLMFWSSGVLQPI